MPYERLTSGTDGGVGVSKGQDVKTVVNSIATGLEAAEVTNATDTALAAVTGRVTTAESALSEVETKADATDAALTTLTGRVTNAEGEIADVSAELQDVADTVNALYKPKGASIKEIKVMASPPTVTESTTNTLSAGQRWAATNNASAPNQLFASGAFSIWRGGYWDIGAAFPDREGIQAKNITNGATFSTLVNQVSFIHTGSRFAVQVKQGSSVLIKVDDEFVTLTPLAIGAGGSFTYVLVDFSGVVATRRIDVLLYNSRFGGIWTDLVASIEPAVRRGLKTFFVGDSFSEGSGNEVSPMWSWCNYVAEYLGLDDATVSGLGATGLIAATAPKVPYIGRIQRDVLDLMPGDETCLLWISLSINDSGSTAEAVGTALNALLDTVDASGKKPIIIISSPTINKGIGDVPANQRLQNETAKAIAASRGCFFVDDIEQALNVQFTQTSTTTTAAVLVNATTVQTAFALIAGATYEFADGTCFFVRSVSGTTATVDKINVAQDSGATVIMRGSCYLTGTGRVGSTAGWGICDLAVSSDGTHPTNTGHKLKAKVDAIALSSALSANIFK
jgi:lysophospholipase L1-like esterase